MEEKGKASVKQWFQKARSNTIKDIKSRALMEFDDCFQAQDEKYGRLERKREWQKEPWNRIPERKIKKT